MDKNDHKEIVHGYEIKRSIVFENDRGFALGENPDAVEPFATWQFTEENGAREYYWGHYVSNSEVAARDYENRVSEYQKDYGLSERDAYKYYSTQRPIDIGTFPKTESGPLYFVSFETREAVELGRVQTWGYLVYDAPLTEKQIADYELKAAPGNPDVKARLREQSQTVGAWEEKHGLPEINRYTKRWLETESFIPTQFVTTEQMAKRYDYAKQELSRAAEKTTVPKPIAEQLAEGEKRAARENADRPTQPPGEKREER